MILPSGRGCATTAMKPPDAATPKSPMKSWIEYWNTDSPVYVSARHKLLHYRLVAGDIAALMRTGDREVLDYGCGEAMSADEVAASCDRLWLCEAGPNLREGLVRRFAGTPAIAVIAPEEISAAIPDGSLDLVVANSLLQYLTRETLDGLIALWRAKLAPGGRLIIGDVIPPDVGPLTDAKALLSFAAKGGFFLAAVAGLVRTAVSDYRKLRAELGLATYTERQMLDILQAAGFEARRLNRNIGHNPARMTFEATKPAASAREAATGDVLLTAHPENDIVTPDPATGPHTHEEPPVPKTRPDLI
jgi:SAM-dependent methyltransferase